MTSVQSAIAQIPRYGKNLIAVSTGASSYTGVNLSATGLQSAVGNNLTFATAANATAALTGGAALVVGQVYRDMGVRYHAFVNGVQIYTVSQVQILQNNLSEGVGGGLAPATYGTYYVVTWTSDSVAGSPAMGVARV
jgi:hypothetical protein